MDADVAHLVFGSGRPEAGEKFFQWLNAGKGRLVTGGLSLEELNVSSEGFRKWAVQARLAGRLKVENGREVDTRTSALQREGKFKSTDPHVLALAQVSEVRLLYTNDGDLQKDFGDKNLIDNPRGKVYSTRVNKGFTTTHKRLLSRTDLCKVDH
ncbi:MAG: hypothetical protein OXD46_15450 [Chloroflexi bacterium]|nr:hypothetical protein [Chloroflexota bacterium]